MEERKEQDNSTSVEDKLAYVDEFGNIESEPPKESNEKDHSKDDK